MQDFKILITLHLTVRDCREYHGITDSLSFRMLVVEYTNHDISFSGGGPSIKPKIMWVVCTLEGRCSKSERRVVTANIFSSEVANIFSGSDSGLPRQLIMGSRKFEFKQIS